jgi:hypothetical protein
VKYWGGCTPVNQLNPKLLRAHEQLQRKEERGPVLYLKIDTYSNEIISLPQLIANALRTN